MDGINDYSGLRARLDHSCDILQRDIARSKKHNLCFEKYPNHLSLSHRLDVTPAENLSYIRELLVDATKLSVAHEKQPGCLQKGAPLRERRGPGSLPEEKVCCRRAFDQAPKNSQKDQGTANG